MKIIKFISIALSPFIFMGCIKSNSHSITSFDGRLKIEFLNEGDSLCYQTLYDDSVIINKASLGILFEYGKEFNTFPMSFSSTSLCHDTIQFGDSTIVLDYNTVDLIYKNDQFVRFRVYNNAIAFRYISHKKNKWHICKELSSWEIPKETDVWFFERKNDWKLKSYAGEWIKCKAKELDKISPTGPVQGIPLIFDYRNSLYGFISEAALYNYSGMRLYCMQDGRMTIDFTEDSGFDIENELISPWRVFYIGSGLNQMVNQHIIQSLNPKPDKDLFKTKNYIKPGKAVWRWWSKGTGTPQQEKQIIGYAKELEFEYSLIDDGWKDWDNAWDQIKKLADYADKLDIALLVWKDSKELNFPKEDYSVMKGWLDSVKISGVSGVKVDFMNNESKSTIDFEIKLLEEAAKRQLLVNFHGCHKPTGESYRYPNELTREGIRGLELNLLHEGPIPATHNAALPFTRFVVGNGDYTPLSFTKTGKTTWTHQLATLICFSSYLQVIAEDPEYLLSNNKLTPILDVIKSIPTVWDETMVLRGSQIGEIAALGRRKGDVWYIGILNVSRRKYRIDFSFLDNEKYLATIINDKFSFNKKQDFIISHQKIYSSSSLNFDLMENGGLVIKIEKIENENIF